MRACCVLLAASVACAVGAVVQAGGLGEFVFMSVFGWTEATCHQDACTGSGKVESSGSEWLRSGLSGGGGRRRGSR